MDQTTLVDRDIEEGRHLVEALDTAGFPVTAALWYFSAQEGIWRLVIASSKVKELGPRAVYTEIQSTMQSANITLPLTQISAVPPDAPIVTEVRIFAGTGGAPYIGGYHLFHTALGNIFIEEAYVYRAERIVGASGTSVAIALTYDKQAKLWRAHYGTMTFKKGWLDAITIEGYELHQRRGRHGITTRINTPYSLVRKDGLVFGDVKRMEFDDGRLMIFDTIATDVRIEGLKEDQIPK